jgi:hypothetical protein
MQTMLFNDKLQHNLKTNFDSSGYGKYENSFE